MQAEQLVDQSGRVLGPRARTTRQRLMDATKALLSERSVRELRVVDIARACDASPATFYQYFKDAEDAVHALAEQAADDMPVVVHWIEEPWEGGSGLARARRIVEAFIRHWDDHHAVLRVRNLAADEGDPRFQLVRARTLSPVVEALAKQIERGVAAGRIPREIQPQAAAAAMSAILERLAAYHQELELLGVDRADLVETSARILHRTVSGED